jgi:endonuclease-3
MGYPIGTMLRRIEAAIAPFPKAAMFALADEGYNSLFEQLVSCIISIRTLDEVTIPISRRLFERARLPEQMLRLGRDELADVLYGAIFPGQKADTILRVAQRAAKEHDTRLPAAFEALTGIKGAGPKCANLALGVAGGQHRVGVDVHVHRVVNRWGLVKTKMPEQTLAALEGLIREKYRRDINRLLMPFGKHICTSRLPRYSTCAVRRWCRQVGVDRSR